MPSLDLAYLLCVFGVVALMLGLAAYAWNHRDLPAIPAFFVMILGVAEWTLAVGLMGVTDPAGAARFWHRAIYLGICIVPLSSLVFFVQFTGRGHWLPPRRIFLLSLPLVFIQALLWTNDIHGLIFSEIEFGKEGLLTVRDETYGQLYWIHASYGHGLIGLGIAYLVFAAFRATAPFRQQIIVLLLATVIPLAASVAETAKVTHYIVVPFGFAATALIMSGSIFHLRFLDLLPVARSKLVDTLPDPIIAVDNLDRIIDANPATVALIAEAAEGRAPGEIIGKTMDQVLGSWRREFSEFRDLTEVKAEIKMKIGGRGRYFDLRITPIVESLQQPRGRLIVLREITEMKAAQRELRRLATTDNLTGAFNRRHFFELAAKEVERSHRYGLPLSLILLDLDHFKRINDEYGHPAGDRVLEAFAGLCRENLREVDVFSRYGGEEFAILLPETHLQAARGAAERLRGKLNDFVLEAGGQRIGMTASMGLSVFLGGEDSIGAMLQRADGALYAAKAGGRNRVEVPSLSSMAGL